MTLNTADTDVVFYNFVHQLVGGLRREESQDRRDRWRQRFAAVQRIAPGFHQGIPPDSAFIEVTCYDLTQNGFSFLLPRPPTFKRLMAAFGPPASAIYLAAEVAHSSDVIVWPSGRTETADDCDSALNHSAEDEPGVPMTLVGCRFIRRLGE
jgi:hypothetical protein